MFGALIRRRERQNGTTSAPQPPLAQSTSFSLSNEVPRPADEPLDYAAAFPMAKLVADEGQTICRIRAITAAGLAAEVRTAVSVGTPLRVELSSEQRVAGRVVWVRGDSVGIKFDDHADMRDFLPKNRVRSGIRARPPRLEIRCDATIRVGRAYHRAQVRDISLGGIKLALADPDCIGKRVVVTVESLRPLRGVVRWYKGAQAGIVFDQPLAFEELAEWMSKRVEFACLKAGVWSGGR